MYLIEILLPLADNQGKRFPHEAYKAVEYELADMFGGVTAYPRAPASGLWKTSDTHQQTDDLVVYEVMAEELDREWWSRYRTQLEKAFRQEKLVVRALDILLL